MKSLHKSQTFSGWQFAIDKSLFSTDRKSIGGMILFPFAGEEIMNIYRLVPINEKHPAWRLSTEKESVWASAPTPTEARELVAAKTKTGGQVATARTLYSPWLDEALASCVLEPSMTHVHSGTVVRADGSMVGDHS